MRVIIINGPMGVGKTTIGKYIAEKYAGTAFIDGDWCMDLHPFVGNRETKTMAIDNILHMIGNYRKCSICKMIVVVWVMDDQWVYQKIADGIAEMGLEIKSVVLVCDQKSLIDRWENDKICDWRTRAWLEVSLGSFSFFVQSVTLKTIKQEQGFVKIKNAVESGGVTETLFRIFDFNLQYLCGRQERKFAVRQLVWIAAFFMK